MSSSKNSRNYHVLLVEDAESILLAIRDYMAPNFHIESASTFEEAKNYITRYKQREEAFDLLITDIHLMHHSGIDLFRYCREISPETKVILMTSYDIDKYIELISEENIDQVVSKHSSMCLKYIEVMTKKLLSKNIFGVDQYFYDMNIYYPSEMPDSLELINRNLYSVSITSPEERVYWVNKISRIFEKEKKILESFSKLILDEITINAMIRAPRLDDSSFKFQETIEGTDVLLPKNNIIMEPEDSFIVQFGYYDDWAIYVCQDSYGTLRKKEILYRLNRHISIDQKTGLPQGLPDSHGRGFFLLREHLTNLTINIEKNRKTEIICMFNAKENTPYKNISIFEIN